MKFVQFVRDGAHSIGVVKNCSENGFSYVDICAADGKIPRSMVDFIAAGDTALKAAKAVLAKELETVYSEQVKLLPPISKMDKVLCVGLNYSDHCEEMNVPLPKQPAIFNKFPSTVIGPQDCVDYSGNISRELDWEVELAVVIGRNAKNVEVSKALDYVFGYSVALDISARDFLASSFNLGQYLLGKSMSTYCPIGPVIATPDEIEDPQNLSIRCSVNDVVKQNSNTCKMVHGVASLISYISKFLTLYPGDVILTGTPPGVGTARNPPEYLKKGDTVECEIESIGKFKVALN